MPRDGRPRSSPRATQGSPRKREPHRDLSQLTSKKRDTAARTAVITHAGPPMRPYGQRACNADVSGQEEEVSSGTHKPGTAHVCERVRTGRRCQQPHRDHFSQRVNTHLHGRGPDLLHGSQALWSHHKSPRLAAMCPGTAETWEAPYSAAAAQPHVGAPRKATWLRNQAE